METVKSLSPAAEAFNILVVGNNPIDLSKLLENLRRMEGKKVITEIAFDFQSIVDRLTRFRPNFILIDDNIGKSELRSMVIELHKDRKTKNIPITILKNSNYHEAISSGVLNYILKENLTGESIYRALVNSLKFRKTQLLLYKAYKKRKGQLMRLFKSEPAFQI